MSPSPHPGRAIAARAFTLVEIFVVLAIMGLLAAISIPALTSVMNSYNLSSAGQSLLGQLTLARQDALANNCAVQVRFYQTPNAKGAMVYRAIQIFRETSDAGGAAKVTPLTSPSLLPDGIWIVYNSAQTNASTLFNTATSGARASAGDPAYPLPPPNGVSPYIYFRFRPNGRTDLASPSLITIAVESAPLVANSLPANFITLQIDPVNGSIRSYQP